MACAVDTKHDLIAKILAERTGLSPKDETANGVLLTWGSKFFEENGILTPAEYQMHLAVSTPSTSLSVVLALATSSKEALLHSFSDPARDVMLSWTLSKQAEFLHIFRQCEQDRLVCFWICTRLVDHHVLTIFPFNKDLSPHYSFEIHGDSNLIHIIRSFYRLRLWTMADNLHGCKHPIISLGDSTTSHCRFCSALTDIRPLWK